MVGAAANGEGDNYAADGTADGDSALQFPCRFPIKAMGLNADDFCAHVLHLLHDYRADFDVKELQQQTSSSGRYVSITLLLQAQSQAQLDAIYQILSDAERVLVAL